MRRYLEDIIAVLLLVAAGVGLLWPWVSGQALPLDLSFAQTLAPWQQPGVAPATALSERHVYESYPAYRHMAAIVEEGGLSWNAQDGIGAPFLAQWHTRALSPFSLPVYFFGVVPGLALSSLMKLLVAGLSAYYVARRFGFHTPMALAVAALFMASAPVYLWSAEPLGDAMPWAPLLLLAAERLALGQRHAWPMVGVATLLVALGGHPPAIAGAVWFLVAYVPLRAAGLSVGERALRLAPALVGLAIGVAAAAAQWWPYLEYLGQTRAGETGMQPVVGLGWRGLLYPAADGARAQFSALLFPGLLPVLLIPLWWVLRPFMEPALRARTGALLVLAALSLLLAALASMAFAQPWLAPWVDASVFLLPPALALAFVAGAVAEEWLLLNADQVRIALPRLMTLVPVSWGVYLAAITWCVFSTGGGASAFAVPLLVTLAAFALFGYTLFRPRARTLGYALTLLACLASVGILMPLKPRTPADNPLPPAPFAEALTSGQFSRIAGSGALATWPLELLGMQQCFGPNTAGLARLERFQQAAAASPLLLRRTGAQGLLLTRKDIHGEMSDIRPVLQTKAVFEQGAILFEDKSMAARARVIYAGKQAGSEDEAPGSAGDLPLLEGAMLPEDGAAESGAAKITSEEPEAVRIAVENTPPGVLVLADQWYPGWTAVVDGQEAPVVPVDAAFRGVELGEGEHQVVLKFEPRSFRIGLIISGIAGVLLALAVWRGFSQ